MGVPLDPLLPEGEIGELPFPKPHDENNHAAGPNPTARRSR